MVFWREMGWKEDEDAVDAREGVCSITDIIAVAVAGDDGGARLGPAASVDATVVVSIVSRQDELPLGANVLETEGR